MSWPAVARRALVNASQLIGAIYPGPNKFLDRDPIREPESQLREGIRFVCCCRLDGLVGVGVDASVCLRGSKSLSLQIGFPGSWKPTHRLTTSSQSVQERQTRTNNHRRADMNGLPGSWLPGTWKRSKQSDPRVNDNRTL